MDFNVADLSLAAYGRKEIELGPFPVLGTLKDTIDAMREQGHKIGVLGIRSFRPFPLAAVRAARELRARLERRAEDDIGVIDRRLANARLIT